MNKITRTKAATLVGLLAISFLVTACNTVAGVGKDTQHAGREIQEEANEHK